MDNSYVPGMCNINTAEVAYRRKAMLFGIGVSVAVFVIAFLLSVNVLIRATILFIPVYIAAIGYLQVRNRFCVSYGAKGRQNADEGSLKSQTVNDEASVTKDKKKSRRMNLQALVITLVILALSCLLPPFSQFYSF